MNFSDINIRDPFVLVENGKYYLYGTRGKTTWTKAYGLDVYVSDDLENWSDPIECFSLPENFWADKEIWAPEVYKYKNNFYMFVSFRSDSRNRGTQILKSDSPEGPFLPFTEGPVTPEDWVCLDGTFYIDNDGKPYMVFCHEWVQTIDGEIHAMPLTDDLSAPAGEPILLFKASEPFWADKSRDTFVTDGPFIYRTKNGKLMMIWSTSTQSGYTQAIAVSDSGKIDGEWIHQKPLFDKDGGHGMIFDDLNGKKFLILHSPNEYLLERPVLIEIEEKDDMLILKGE
ncbi:MAG: family 43 glycosylhydrolase [Clostridia bacterium]|nr:family 43 glycosylhydrolase [Clostridia bacterium]